ncbi:BRI1 kinase inhibitor 1-like [Vicia villosa]|uniref:BRI1 kinase inhibitor 1-like n=1 Tax=Vicia villosa TaxID=3911 RepID=UPI00273C1701|nr:BRI1 kinase inhibitor 1-like [Vicia villosa]
MHSRREGKKTIIQQISYFASKNLVLFFKATLTIVMENHIEVEKQQQKPSQPSSQSSSPTHEFSFTISHNTFNKSFQNSNNKSKSSSPNSFTALDLSPADDIFFHGHLLPLQILSNFPSSISPRASTNSMDSFTLPIRELFSEEEDDENLPTKESSIKNMESSKKVEGKFKFGFSLFSSAKGTKGCHKEKEKNKKKVRFDFHVIHHAMKKCLRMVKPIFKKEKIRVHDKKCYSSSYSGNVTPRNKQEMMKSWKLGQYSSAPASMRTSPSNSGLLFPTTPLTPATDSSMEELQNAIQAAIAHCKNSYSKDEKLNC